MSAYAISRESVSVIIPIYNAEKTIDKCLESVLSQKGPSLEVICVNDGSADGSLAKLKTWSYTEPRIILIDQHNRGSGPARNAAISQSTGKWIAFLDPDDWLPHDHVYKDLINAAIYSDARIAGGNFLRFDDDGHLMGEDRNRWFKGNLVMRFSDTEDAFGYTRYVYRRDLIIDNSISFPALYRGQDLVFMTQVMEAEDKFATIEEAVYCAANMPGGHIVWNSRKLKDHIDAIDILVQYSSKKKYGYMHSAAMTRLALDSVITSVYLDEDRVDLSRRYRKALSHVDRRLLKNMDVYDRLQAELHQLDTLSERALHRHLRKRKNISSLKNGITRLLYCASPSLYNKLHNQHAMPTGRYDFV